MTSERDEAHIDPVSASAAPPISAQQNGAAKEKTGAMPEIRRNRTFSIKQT